jgi:putative flippase GtrA
MKSNRSNIQNLLKSPLVRYILVGGSSFVIELSCIYIITQLTHDGMRAVAISFWVGLITAFILQKTIAFQNQSKNPKAILTQIVAYITLVAINYAFTLGFVALMQAILGIYVARTIALIITTGWNFVIYKKIIFNDSRTAQPSLPISIMRQTVISLAQRHRWFFIGLLPVLVWCAPYFLSGNKIELGDFSFFLQGYEAIRISIVEYHQFPWWNPWVSGGIPLYANPQFGVFSITTVLTLIAGPIFAVKSTVVLFTIAGYTSMYVFLRKLLRPSPLIATLLSILWVMCSFFVVHLPSHFTFIWYLVAPLFIYLTLTIRTVRGGLVFAALYAVMGYMQLHNSFVHISLICLIIACCRIAYTLLRSTWAGLRLIRTFGIFALAFAVLISHRFLFTYQNMHEFPRDNIDLVPSKLTAVMGLLAPYSQAHALKFISYPPHPFAPHSFGEATATIGIFALIALFIAFLYLCFSLWRSFTNMKNTPTVHRRILEVLHHNRFMLGLFLTYSVVVLIGFGAQSSLMPYSLLKHLPIVSEMRISTRWYIFAVIAMLAIIARYSIEIRRIQFVNFLLIALLLFGIAENLVINFGHQYTILRWTPNTYIGTKTPDFNQTSYFGNVTSIDNGAINIPKDTKMPAEYREFESTTYNQGVLYANDSFVQIQLANTPSPLCPVDKGCALIPSKNAIIQYWSPNKLILRRVSPGPIRMNINPSSYMLVNGQRYELTSDDRVAEPFQSLTITDESNTIIITYNPSAPRALQSILRKTPKKYHNYISD